MTLKIRLGVMQAVAGPIAFLLTLPASGGADPNQTVQGGARSEFRETLHTAADHRIPAYKPVENLHGKLVAMGTDTMNDLMKIWIAQFQLIYPEVAIVMEAKGSLTGAAPLTEGRSQLAMFSREMFPAEIEAFRIKHGYAPLQVRAALGGYRAPDRTGISIFFVNRENPIVGLSLPQIGAMYSDSSGRTPLTTWGQLGLTGEWADRPIHPIGITSPDGTANYIQHFACGDAPFTPRLKGEKAGLPIKASVRILQDIAKDKGAIGYASLLYENPGTKQIAIAATEGGPFYEGTFDEVVAAKYPLTRYVYLYADLPPGGTLPATAREFLKFVLSYEGQAGVEKEGLFLPLPLALIPAEIAKVK